MDPQQERGVLFSLFLIISFGASAWAAVVLIFLGGDFGTGHVALSAGGLQFTGALCIIRLLSIVSVWYWSKFGVVIYLLDAVVLLVVASSLDLMVTWPAITMPLLMLFFAVPQWHRMVWVPYGKMYD